jgi:hypothetical protein
VIATQGIKQMINANPIKIKYRQYTILIQTQNHNYRVLIQDPQGEDLCYKYFSKSFGKAGVRDKVCKWLDKSIQKQAEKEELKRLKVEDKLIRQTKRSPTNTYPEHWDAQMKSRWLRYQKRCRELNREFTLTFEEFFDLFSIPCAYCNKFYKQSIDRIDSSVGYISGNCQPCCSICNGMKSNMPEDIFKEHLLKILAHRGWSTS